MSDIITIDKNGSGQRIDKYLSDIFPYSRNFFHHIIDRGGVRLSNNKSIKKSHKLKEGEKIHIDSLKRYLDGAVMEEAPQIEIPIVYEEEDYIVINKPKGVLSHPNSIRDVGSPSVVGRLYHHYKDLPSIGSFVRAGLIHRLDKETDGLMIIAKTEKGLAHFKKLFQQKSESDSIEAKEAVPLKKFYQAGCRVRPEGQDFLDTLLLGARQENHDRIIAYKLSKPHYIIQDVVPKVPHSMIKTGITKVLEIKQSPDDRISGPYPHITLYLEILTGRTHQIRYHLSEHGLPVMGDYLYGIEQDQKTKDTQQSLQLSAHKLLFQNINRETKELSIKTKDID